MSGFRAMLVNEVYVVISCIYLTMQSLFSKIAAEMFGQGNFQISTLAKIRLHRWNLTYRIQRYDLFCLL